MEHAFGRGVPFGVGMEEELILVDRDTLALSHSATAVLPRIPAAAGCVVHDAYEALVELVTPVCGSAVDAGANLDALRSAVRTTGATAIGAGLHPTAAFGDVVHAPRKRYRAIADAMRGLLCRTPTAALHAHVGMPDAETAIGCCNRLRAHLPLLQALAAHSPYWHGIDAGFASARAQVFRGFPSAVIPRAFAGWDDYAEAAAAWVAAGELPDYTFLWWDIRPHPRLGTVEVRAMDSQARLGATVGLGALVHALALACADATGPPPPHDEIVESSFRASRDGLRARIWWRGGLRPVAEVAAAALRIARPYARQLGADGPLDEIERVVREGNGADRMRAARARGGLPAVLGLLREETAQGL